MKPRKPKATEDMTCDLCRKEFSGKPYLCPRDEEMVFCSEQCLDEHTEIAADRAWLDGGDEEG